jgi:ATP-dependent protease ClpP protease subunit
MQTYDEIYAEVQSRRVESPQDYVLKKYLKKLYKYTGRHLVLYASAFSESEVSGRSLQLGRQDVSCFMAAAAGADSRELDLILHSPGGAVEAAEQIVTFLRRRFDDIRVIVPVCALSSAALMACAADRIVLADHSALGPFDPIVNWAHDGESYSAGAQTIINEYSIAQRNINNKRNDPALWIERLKAFPPGLLATCRSQIQHSQSLAHRWLASYMFRGEEAGAERAESIAVWLSDSRHSAESPRSIGLSDAVSKGLKAERLDDDEKLLENVMAVFHAGIVKFQSDDCVKIVENENGRGCTFASRPPAASS